MDLPDIRLISSDSDIQQLNAMNLKKRGLPILETSPEEEILPTGSKPQLIILDLNSFDEPDWKIASRLCEKNGTVGTVII